MGDFFNFFLIKCSQTNQQCVLDGRGFSFNRTGLSFAKSFFFKALVSFPDICLVV